MDELGKMGLVGQSQMDADQPSRVAVVLSTPVAGLAYAPKDLGDHPVLRVDLADLGVAPCCRNQAFRGEVASRRPLELVGAYVLCL